MQIFDTHTHDYFDSFDDDRDSMMMANFDSGIVGKIQIGCDEKSSIQALELAKKYSQVWSTVGLHPCDVSKNYNDIGVLFEKFQLLIDENPEKIIGVGETGFDFFHNDFEQMRSEQMHSFEMHLFLAQKNSIPVVIHTRDAADETIAFMRGRKKNLGKGVFHCFSQNTDFARIATEEFGYFLGIGGTATYPKNQYIRDAIEATPLEFLVTETDSPFLSPQSKRGKRNTSSNIAEIIVLIATLKKIDPIACSQALVENAQRLFNLNKSC